MPDATSAQQQQQPSPTQGIDYGALAQQLDETAPAQPQQQQQPTPQSTAPSPTPAIDYGALAAEVDPPQPASAPSDGSGVTIEEAPLPQQAPPGGFPAEPKSPYGDLSGVLGTPGDNDSVHPADSAADAAMGGALQGVFAAKDLLSGGEPSPSDESQFRRNVEGETAAATDGSLFNSLVAGISQFGIGMLGVGRAAAVARALPELGAAAEEAPASVKFVGESLKAALVGSTFFSPHSPNVANLVQNVPALQNPLTEFLATKPEDSGALGRMKNAFASIGVDATLIGAFTAAAKIAKLVRGGADQASIAAASDDLASQLKSVNVKAQQPAEAAEAQNARGLSPAPAASSDTGIPKDETVGSLPQGAPAVAAVPARLKTVELSDEQVTSILQHSQRDNDALMQHGSWENAIDAGHRFGDGVNIPWEKMIGDGTGTVTTVDAMIKRVADAVRPSLDDLKGGDIVTDTLHSKMLAQRAALWNEDPNALIGLLQTAGRNSITLRANMDASFFVASRAFQDASALAARIQAGDLTEFADSRAAAIDAFKKTSELAVTAYGEANAMRANVGRAFRGLQGQFGPTPSDLASWRANDPEVTLRLFADAEGDPRKLTKLAQPGLWEPGGLAYAAKKFGSWAQFLLVNNLVSSPFTHAAILATNAYQVVSRPAERVIGAAILRPFTRNEGQIKELDRISLSGRQQYVEMHNTVGEAFRNAVTAFKTGDSTMAPHTLSSEVGQSQAGLGQTVALMPWKPFDSVPNITKNVLTFLAKAFGAPTRFVGAQDELVKQIVYRSKVAANAFADGMSKGLTGEALGGYVNKAIGAAFDEFGHATNQQLLNEARIATYQQDLPTTGSIAFVPTDFALGSAVQKFVADFPPLRVILPFIRTPANLFRNGVKLTPGLNLLQREYRRMISGAMGVEQQTQAIGQAAVGSLLFGVTALLAHEGFVRGGFPEDANAKAALFNDGQHPYSFMIPQKDGSKLVIPFDRYDPVAMPLGAMADIMDVATHPDPAVARKSEPMAAALFMALSRQLTDKIYLQSLSRLIDGLNEPDKTLWQKFKKTAGSELSEYFPFSSLDRLANGAFIDPTMREAWSFIDTVKKGVPGFSKDLPPMRDPFGEPVTVHSGLWMKSPNNIVDQEMARMAADQGLALGQPSYQTHAHVDLRTVRMKDGSNAYDTLEKLSAQPQPDAPRLKDAVGEMMRTDGYKSAPDGDSSDPGTKLSLLLRLVNSYRSGARAIVNADPNVRAANAANTQAMKAAKAAQKVNPTPANQQSQMLDNLSKATGVDMHALVNTGGIKPPTPVR